MSILIQAGHYSSYSNALMQEMYERGLGKPAESYTHKLTSLQVTDTIYKILCRTDMSVANNKLADNIMIDFLLANLDTENWGWAHEKNLLALDYWQQLEPDVRFILVFDHPNQLLAQLTNTNLTQDIVDRTINNWVEYHTKMLAIVEDYDDKAILIEGACALDNISNLGEKVKVIASSLQLKSQWQVLYNATNQAINDKIMPIKQIDVVADHINNEILKKYPEAIKLFNALLSKAVLKSSEPIYKTKPTELHSLITVLNNIQEQQHNEDYLVENQKLSQQINEVQLIHSQEVQNLKLQYQKSVEENNVILKQLQEVQEKLQKKTIENEKNQQVSKSNSELLERKIKELNAAKYELEKQVMNDQRVVDPYKPNLDKLQAKSREETSVEQLEKENEMLLKQLHYTQEELEKYYSKNQSLTSSNVAVEKPQKKIVVQQPTTALIQHGAADRIKNDLPYRLGSKMVKAKKPKDLAMLPVTLAKEYYDFQKSEKPQYSVSGIEDSRDSQEIERIKSHLSYQIGNILVESFESPRKLISIPLNISRKIIVFKNN